MSSAAFSGVPRRRASPRCPPAPRCPSMLRRLGSTRRVVVDGRRPVDVLAPSILFDALRRGSLGLQCRSVRRGRPPAGGSPLRQCDAREDHGPADGLVPVQPLVQHQHAQGRRDQRDHVRDARRHRGTGDRQHAPEEDVGQAGPAETERQDRQGRRGRERPGEGRRDRERQDQHGTDGQLDRRQGDVGQSGAGEPPPAPRVAQAVAERRAEQHEAARQVDRSRVPHAEQHRDAAEPEDQPADLQPVGPLGRQQQRDEHRREQGRRRVDEPGQHGADPLLSQREQHERDRRHHRADDHEVTDAPPLHPDALATHQEDQRQHHEPDDDPPERHLRRGERLQRRGDEQEAASPQRREQQVRADPAAGRGRGRTHGRILSRGTDIPDHASTLTTPSFGRRPRRDGAPHRPSSKAAPSVDEARRSAGAAETVAPDGIPSADARRARDVSPFARSGPMTQRRPRSRPLPWRVVGAAVVRRVGRRGRVVVVWLVGVRRRRGRPGWGRGGGRRSVRVGRSIGRPRWCGCR